MTFFIFKASNKRNCLFFFFNNSKKINFYEIS